jgi:hypothetical protein
MAMAIETSIVRYIGSAAEVRAGALGTLKPPMGSTFYCSDIKSATFDGREWALLTPKPRRARASGAVAHRHPGRVEGTAHGAAKRKVGAAPYGLYASTWAGTRESL